MATYTVHLQINAEDDHDALKQAAGIRSLLRWEKRISTPVVEVTDTDDWSEHVDMMCAGMCGGLSDDRTRWGGRRWCKPCLQDEGKEPYAIEEA